MNKQTGEAMEEYKCQRCGGIRTASICAKSSDRNSGEVITTKFNGYVPEGCGIGGDDYINFEWCLDCGQIQGEFPCHTKNIKIDGTHIIAG